MLCTNSQAVNFNRNNKIKESFSNLKGIHMDHYVSDARVFLSEWLPFPDITCYPGLKRDGGDYMAEITTCTCSHLQPELSFGDEELFTIGYICLLYCHFDHWYRKGHQRGLLTLSTHLDVHTIHRPSNLSRSETGDFLGF